MQTLASLLACPMTLADNILPLLNNIKNTKKNFNQMLQLWLLNIPDECQQLIVPGSKELYTPDEFKAVLAPTGKQMDAYKYIYKALSTTNSVPLRESQPCPEDVDTIVLSQTATTVDTNKRSRSGRTIKRPLQPDEIPNSSQPVKKREALKRPPEPEPHFYTAPPPAPWQNYSANNRVTFVKEETNPDHDIEPSQEYSCFEHGDRVFFYPPSGNLAGSRDIHSVKHLWELFSVNSQRPDLQYLGPKSFAQEMCYLFSRYECSERTEKGNSSTTQSQASLPFMIQAALYKAFDIETERFASPLNITPGLTKRYFSRYARDALFGAERDAFSRRWTGSSLANPEFDREQLDAALSWAVKSAVTTDVPVLTIMLTPIMTDSSKHMRWTQHPLVQTLTKINRGRVTFTHHSYTRPKPNNTRSRDELHLLLMANAAGIAHYAKE